MERCINRFNAYRGLATRFKRRAFAYLALITLAAIRNSSNCLHFLAPPPVTDQGPISYAQITHARQLPIALLAQLLGETVGLTIDFDQQGLQFVSCGLAATRHGQHLHSHDEHVQAGRLGALVALGVTFLFLACGRLVGVSEG